MAQQLLEADNAEVTAGGGYRGRLADVDLGGGRHGHLGRADLGQHLGDRGVGRDDHRMRGHQTARCRRVVTKKPAQVGRLDGLHRGQEPFPLLERQFREQVRGVVGLHLLDDIGAALQAEPGQEPDLVLLGHLLEHVGQLLVLQRLDDLPPPGG